MGKKVQSKILNNLSRQTFIRIKHFSIVLFGLAFVGLNVLTFTGRYVLSTEQIQQSLTEKQREVLEVSLHEITGIVYTSPIQLSADIIERFKQENNYLKQQEEWDKVLWDSPQEIAFTLVKASAQKSFLQVLSPYFWVLFILSVLAALLSIFATQKLDGLPGVKNTDTFLQSATSRGWLGIITGTWLILFYIVLYWFPAYIVNWVLPLDGLSSMLNGSDAGRWFLYGFLYCVAMCVMGLRMYYRYRHNAYQKVRTFSVLFFQLCFAFIIPELLVRFNMPYMDFKNAWPLDYDFFFDWNVSALLSSGKIGIFMLVWGIILALVVVPICTYFWGKRWYCSWVCGCGGLAETLGDPYRHLSDKRLRAWKIERWMIHAVLLFAIILTAASLYTWFTGKSDIIGISTHTLQQVYGFFIGSAFAGVIGTGFYPLMGNRVWCRFGCPLAAYMGIIQRFKSRFRISTNGAQCISCGNCSVYCEMGIDVRWYAQRDQSVVRASCVGCGICAAVCPRGVLKLENKEEKGRLG